MLIQQPPLSITIPTTTTTPRGINNRTNDTATQAAREGHLVFLTAERIFALHPYRRNERPTFGLLDDRARGLVPGLVPGLVLDHLITDPIVTGAPQAGPHEAGVGRLTTPRDLITHPLGLLLRIQHVIQVIEMSTPITHIQQRPHCHRRKIITIQAVITVKEKTTMGMFVSHRTTLSEAEKRKRD